MADQEFLASSMRASDARQDPGEERSVRIREKNGLSGSGRRTVLTGWRSFFIISSKNRAHRTLKGEECI